MTVVIFSPFLWYTSKDEVTIIVLFNHVYTFPFLYSAEVFNKLKMFLDTRTNMIQSTAKLDMS